MENQKQNLEVQLREAYGRITYSYTTHLKMANRLENKNKNLKYCQIALSAIITAGFLGSFIFDEQLLTFLSGLISAISLGLNLYFKDFNLAEQSKRHQVSSDRLWLIREKYVGVLTDLDALSIKEIMKIRDSLRDETYVVYCESPKTDRKSYLKAQEALKDEEEQFFSEKELDQMLPEHLRKSKN